MADSATNAQTVPLPFINGRWYTTMPNDGFLTTVKYKIWGAGGGAGAADSQAGGNGAGGAYVEGVLYLQPGQVLEVFVGQGGGQGAGGGNAPGGYNGKSGTGYSGGRGGNSGPAGYSGSGGGGGGATVIKVNSLPIIIASGGGGGGGGGNRSGGISAVASFTPTYKSYAAPADQGRGTAGGDHPGDGGGGGGGGGGNMSGEGGNYGNGDVGGAAGFAGTNKQFLLDPLVTGIYQNGRLPGGYNYEDYPGSSVGIGGLNQASGAQPGGNGFAILTFYRASGIFVKAGGNYARVRHRMKVRGNYQNKINSWVKVAGIWHPINSDAQISFASDQINWSDPGLPRYIPPPPPPVKVTYIASERTYGDGRGGGGRGDGGSNGCGGNQNGGSSNSCGKGD